MNTKKSMMPILSMLLFACLYLVSCVSEDKTLPASSGKTAEILFVIDKAHWDGIAGDSIKTIFRSEFLVLNQPEPLFSLANVEEKNFTKIFESHRNIFIVDIKPEHESANLEIRKNVWSQPQIVIRISARSAADFNQKLNTKRDYIIELLFDNERDRMMRAFKRDEDKSIADELKKHYGISLVIPNGYFIAVADDNFCWIRRETEETSMNVMVYFKPYDNVAVFTPEDIIAHRNMVSRSYVPGPREGSYMKVSQTLVMPIFNEVNFKDMYAIETRGLWDLHRDFMGGPFVNYTFVDEASNRVVNLDAFVYAPRFNKRDYIIQGEALLYSFEFFKPKTE